MPRSAEQYEELRERSRERILEAGLELFAERGFGSTSVRALAERAGVSQGLLYNYFDGKRALLRAIFRRGSEQVADTFAEAEAAVPAESLAVLIRAAFDAVRHHRTFWRLSYQIRMQPEVLADVGPEIVERAAAIRVRIEELLERAGVARAGTRAALLFAAIDGTAQHYVLDPGHFPLEEVAEEMVRRLVPPVDPNGKGEEGT